MTPTPTFDLAAPGFSPANALACCDASQAAYDAADIETPLAHVLVIEYPTHLVIACRGSKHPRDFLTDAECWLIPTAYGRGHRGFVMGAGSVIQQVMDRVTIWQQAHPGLPIFFCGHSYGGALARRLALSCKMRNPYCIVWLYTYGEPRGGDRQYAELCNHHLAGHSFRIRNEEDIVTVSPVPLLWPQRIAGFYHADQLHMFTATGQFITEPGIIVRILSDAVGIYQAYRRGQYLDLLDDHYLAAYRTRLVTLLAA